MISCKILELFPTILDNKGRINGNLSRMKNIREITLYVNSELANDFLIDNYSLKDKINFILKSPDISRCFCEICNKPTKYVKKTNSFTSFCSFNCSRTPGSSTFLKAKSTCLEKYGVTSNLALPANFEKIYLKYGGIGAGSTILSDKIKRTNLERYGVENVFAVNTIKDKIKQTHNERFGGNYQSIKLGNKIKLLEDKEYCQNLAKQFCMSTICEMIGVASNTIYRYFEKHQITSFNRSRSHAETELITFIKSLGIDNIISGERNLISPLEIDIYLPDFNLGIEFNGIYWHSELVGTKSNYHLHKLELANNAGIQLIQIFENEWELKQEIVKSKITSLLGKSKKIYARKCEIRKVSTLDKKLFLTKNHIQGDAASSICLGLYYNSKLVSLMTFSKSRFDKIADFELIRYCSILNTTVIGGFSKLLTNFRKSTKGSIISYADRRFSIGNVYLKNGFELIGTSQPAYFYFKNSSIVLENRMKYQKHKLQKILEKFNSELSEWENMKENGYNRIWDCGTSKWLLK